MTQHSCSRRYSRVLSAIIAVMFLTLAFPTAKAYASESTLPEVKQIIKQYYVDEVPDSVLDSATTVKDLLNAVGDPHTMYFTPSEYKDFVGGIDNNFVGIGIQLEMVPEGVKVVSVFDNSPAKDAGILADDILIEANGHSLAGLPSDKATSYVKGEEGTKVTLKVKRNNTVLTFNLLRKAVQAPTVEGKLLDGKIGYIKLSSFGKDSFDEFGKELDKLNVSSPGSYIVDLRDDLGGYLVTAINIAGYFIKGQTVLRTKGRGGNEDLYFSPSSVKQIDKPVIFLINGNSASASEILSAAVKDYKKAFILGTRSYGKGTVQTMFDLSNGDVFKMTVRRFFSPFGNAINKVGITPDIDTKDADALSAAELLLGSSGTNKTGFVKVEKNGRSFEIDLSKASQPQYVKAYSKIVESAMDGGRLLMGNSSGWSEAPASIGESFAQYFPGYKTMPSLNNVETNKKFTIAFNNDVDSAMMGNGDVELVDSTDGRQISLNLRNIDSRRIEATPQSFLTAGRRYYMVIHNSVKARKGGSMDKGAIITVDVKK